MLEFIIDILRGEMAVIRVTFGKSIAFTWLRFGWKETRCRFDIAMRLSIPPPLSKLLFLAVPPVYAINLATFNQEIEILLKDLSNFSINLSINFKT